MGRLDDKVVIITGAAGGIGAVTARRVAREGARVVLADIDIDAASVVARQIDAAGGSAYALRLDLADPDSIQAMVIATVERFGGLDTLHNNAADTILAARHDSPIADADPAVWDRTLTVNLRGGMLAIKAALPHLIARGGGSIINTSSAAAASGDMRNPAYAASKAGIEAMTRHVATHAGKNGVRCNAIAPGLIVTAASRASAEGGMHEMMLRHHLTPRLGRPDDVAALVVFLASDEAEFITGQTLVVDGGMLAHQPYYADLRSK